MRIAASTVASLGIIASLLAPVLPARALVLDVNGGDLIKLKDDRNPFTETDKVVYYLDQDWKRRPFPNNAVYKSWYFDFLNVKELTPEEMAEFRVGAPIIFRPGTRLVKIASIPKVYAVEPGGILRWIESEEIAAALYGKDWNKRVDDVPEAYFTSYREGVPLTVAAWPTGTYVKRESDGAFFLIDGAQKRPVSAEVATAVRLYAHHAIVTDGALAEYADGGAVTAPEIAALDRIADTSQLNFADTPPVPAIDFPKQGGASPGNGAVIARFRVTTGMPVNLNKVTVKLPPEIPLTDVHVTDASGTSLFGTNQRDGNKPIVFTGGYEMHKAGSYDLFIRATLPVTVPSGTPLTASFSRDGFAFSDAGNGNDLKTFWYPTMLVSRAK